MRPWAGRLTFLSPNPLWSGTPRCLELCGFREMDELPRHLAEDTSGAWCPLEAEQLSHRPLLCHPTHSRWISSSQGRFHRSAAWRGSSRHQPLPCSLPPDQVSVSTLQGRDGSLSSPGGTHSPRSISGPCAFTEDLAPKGAEEVCLARSSKNQSKPNKT